MLKYADYDIVFQEIPDQITLAINISGCPNRCQGCHTPSLMDNIGEDLTETVVAELVQKYSSAITCVCFMGGDSEPDRISQLATFVKDESDGKLKTAWYSGKQYLPTDFDFERFDFIKLGPYVEKLGGLTSPITNQHFYRIENGKMIDITGGFKSLPLSAQELR